MNTIPLKGSGGDEGCPSPLPHQRTSLSTVAHALCGVTGRVGAFVHAGVGL